MVDATRSDWLPHEVCDQGDWILGFGIAVIVYGPASPGCPQSRTAGLYERGDSSELQVVVINLDFLAYACLDCCDFLSIRHCTRSVEVDQPAHFDACFLGELREGESGTANQIR